MKVRSSQIGSLASFIVIGIVLVVAAGSLLYWVNHRDTAPTTTQQPVVSQPDENKDENKNDQPEATPSDAPVESSPVAPTESHVAVAPAPVVDQLSQTGPADTAFQIVATGLVVAALAGFVRSRQLRSSL